MKRTNLTLAQMREKGWIDGYTGQKSQIATFNFKFYNIPSNEINLYKTEYKNGYKAGQLLSGNLQDIKLKNNVLMYDNKCIDNLNKSKTYKKTRR